MQYVGSQVKYILKWGAIHRQSQEIIRTPRESERMKDYRALVVERYSLWTTNF